MDFRILGPLEILSDENDRIELTRPLMRVVVVTLLLHRGQSVPASRLIDLLWGPDGQAGDPLHSLRNAIWSVRQELPRGRLQTDAVGYRLRIEPTDHLDLDRFRSLHRDGEAALRDGQAERSAILLSQALKLWRHPPPNMPDTPAMTSLMAGLLDEHRDARNTWIQARLALGEHRELLPELREWVSADPANEGLWADLMLSLYHCDRKADALRAFDQARAALAAYTGTEPGPQLRRLHEQIRTDNPAVRPRENTARREPVRPHQLAADLMDFTGRVGTTAQLTHLLVPSPEATSVPIIEITGPPGVGKTALALHVAHLLNEQFPDGQLYLPLAGTSPSPRQPQAVLADCLTALGIPGSDIPDTLTQRAALYRTRLAGRRLLLLLDDAASTHQVEPLLPGRPGCAVVVTSRIRLPGLPGARHHRLEPLEHPDAVALLRRILGPERIAADPHAADAIATACGRLPLALRIAAERLAMRPNWPLSHLAALLHDDRHRLDELSTGELSLRASFAASYQKLPEPIQQGFRLLALAADHEVPEWAVNTLLGDGAAEVIDTLLDHSLLTTTGIDQLGQPRYQLPTLIRDYATELLTTHDPGQRRDAIERSITAWTDLAARANDALPHAPQLPPIESPPTPTGHLDPAIRRRVSADPQAWFTLEGRNLLNIIAVACANDLAHHAAHLAARLAPYLHHVQRHSDAQQMWTTIAQAAEAAGDHSLAQQARMRATH